MKKHEWREKTEEGATRLVTAVRHAGKWQLRSRLKSDLEWTEFPTIELDDLETLHDIISKKYQRNRCSSRTSLRNRSSDCCRKASEITVLTSNKH